MASNNMELDLSVSMTTIESINSVTSCINSMHMNPLKRSNSAPMINMLGIALPAVTQTTTTVVQAGPSSGRDGRNLERVRRFSTSSMALHSPTKPTKIPSRVIQIIQDESLPVKDREMAHEREIQSAINLSHSMEDFCHMDTPVPAEPKRPKSLGEPLHIHVTSYCPFTSSPSPTRVGKQCFSPSLQQPIGPAPVLRSNHGNTMNTLTPSPSPSPTRKTFSRRSLSPITLRPSPLGGAFKRKMETDDRSDLYFSPPKRFHSAHSPGGSTPERAPNAYHPLINSISSSSFEESASEHHMMHKVSTVTTSATMSHGHSTISPSSCFSFRPVRVSTESHGTDSEMSDMTETTDISENTDMLTSHTSPASVSPPDVHMSQCHSSSSFVSPSSVETTAAVSQVSVTVSGVISTPKGYISGRSTSV